MKASKPVFSASRRFAVAAPLLFIAAVAAPGLSPAQDFPSRPIRLIVPFPPGGPTDIVARPMAQMLGDALKQTVIIDNRGGAGGTIGADAVAKSAADGYTLLMGTVGTSAINGSLYSKLPHDPVGDFTPIALVASAPVAVVVHPDIPLKSVRDLIEKARAEPASLLFGSAGSGTPGHLTGEMFATAAGVKLQHVPYKGSAPAVTDLLGKQIPMMFDPLQSVIQHIKAGKLRVLAVSGSRRSPVLPDVPTLAESGVENFESTAWWGVFGPAGLPPAVSARLKNEVERIAASEVFKEKLGDLGVVPMTGTGSLAEFQKREIEKWGDAVRKSGAKAD
ncbi:MAG: tripartite tricarboxylate transporter substrate binding protein [Lautropia sp.]|nr:tripartite tricarboxylate transporter substrate binding protein [Lautropia sp.]